MLNQQQQFGKKSESLATKLLEARGYIILEKNYRTRAGEIDIIAKDGDTLVFVEVKARTDNRFGNPKYAITNRKQRNISRAALSYLKAKKQMKSKARFDVVSICSGKQVEIIKNAFDIPSL